MRRFQFTDDEYNKLSAVTGFPAVDLQKLDALGLLANDVAIRMVLEYEYNRQRKTTKALPKLILQAIANKYGLTPQKVRGFLFHRKRPVYYCSKCNKEISQSERKKFNGLCEKCAVDSIKL